LFAGSTWSSSHLRVIQPMILNRDLRVEGMGSTIIEPRAVLSGRGGLDLRVGDLLIESRATYSGETRIAFSSDAEVPSAQTASILTLRGAAGALENTSGITIERNSLLRIDSSLPFSGGAAGRIGDSTPINLNSGRLELIGDHFAPIFEKIGDLSISGANSVGISPSGGGVTTLAVESLRRIGRGTLEINFNTAGGPPGSSPDRMLVAQSLSSDLVGAGGINERVSILPYVIATDELATYDGNGIRRLDVTREYTNSLDSAVAGSNVRLLSGTYVVEGERMVNALVLAGGGHSIGGPGRLTITSGVIISNYATISANLNFGAQEANIYLSSHTTLSGELTGSNGLTVSGPFHGTLSLPDSNGISGPLTINNVNVTFDSLAALGAGESPISIHNPRIDTGVFSTGLVYTGATPLNFTRPIHIEGGFATFDVGPNNVTVSGGISGPGGFATKSSGEGISSNGQGMGVMTLMGTNTYSGPTIVQSPLVFDGDAALGTGSAVELKSGRLTMAAPWVTQRRLIVSGFATLDTNGHPAIVSGLIEGTASSRLTVTGLGSVTVADMSLVQGGLIIEQATLRLNGQLAPGLPATIRAGAILTGDADVQRSLDVYGRLEPGTGIGMMKVEELTLFVGSTLALEIGSSFEYDQVRVGRGLRLGANVELSLLFHYIPVGGESFLIVSNGAPVPVRRFPPSGAFSVGGQQLTEGSKFFAGGNQMSITYYGGDGNDIVLHVIPEPSTLGLLAFGGCGVLLAGRRRRRG
jgi:hypothetical protein